VFAINKIVATLSKLGNSNEGLRRTIEIEKMTNLMRNEIIYLL
jgi:hypothetical protein